MSKLIKFSIVLLLVASVASAVPIENKESALDFILLHNNDLHAHFEEMSDSGSECSPERALEHKCYGGFGRAATLIKRYRADHQTRNGLPVLFLNGGDTYTGTPYFQMFKDKIASEFMNILKPDVALLAKYRPSVEALTKDIITYSKVELKNDCRDCDCNIGNLITDAFVYNRVQMYDRSDAAWTDASIAFINAGAIRSGATIGNLSKFTLSTILPFDDRLHIVHIPGREVKKTLEHTMKGFVLGDYTRGYLQMSGVRVVYNLQKEEGQRVHSVEVLCANCTAPTYEPLDEQKTYGVILSTFIFEGGDSFSMFKSYNAVDTKIKMADAVINYIRRFESIYPAIEGRIRFIGVNEVIDNVSTSASNVVTPFSVVMLIATTLLLFAIFFYSIIS
ncbi:protein 5NUC-like [Contarinia nasturtii]|uniref:protein 5NUC-like n=1 Tax=Contarinia nasturtii TaxID=265458 RepID=UPI0012D3A540|nr:protein 5NUC-like [Contarinia nasturtii]